MKKNFFRYVVPSVLAMWVYALYTMVDGMFVAKGVGEYALAAINLSMPMINTIFAVSILFAIGTSTITSIFLGQKEIRKAKEAFSMNMSVLFAT
ncbi:hypothetical protein JYG23_02350 [Sedimentibacter sp. zth1]|nr:hypothetical protein JYG23_02350 [Sedimentibacter sp. zth1]